MTVEAAAKQIRCPTSQSITMAYSLHPKNELLYWVVWYISKFTVETLLLDDSMQ